MNPSKYFFHAGIKKFLSRQNSDPWRGYKGPEDLPFRASLLSESQILDFGPMEGVLPKTFPATEPAGVMMLSLSVFLSACGWIRSCEFR